MKFQESYKNFDNVNKYDVLLHNILKVNSPYAQINKEFFHGMRYY